MTGPISMPAKQVKFQRFVLIVSLVCSSSAFGQQVGKNELADGPFQQNREAMQKLVRLKLNGNALTLRRKWDSPRNKDGEPDQMDVVVQAVAKKAYPNASLGEAFFALRAGAGSHGHQSSESYSRFDFRTHTLFGDAELKNDRIRFLLFELALPERELRVEDHPDGRFEFRYSGDGFLVELRQKNDGSIRISRIRDDQADVFSAVNFVALRKQEPELIEGWLLPLFEHLGFSLPLEADDPAVQQAALTRLDTSAAFVAEDFRKLLADLDADEFSVRNTASETLQAQRVLYAEAIRQELESESLSPEVRTRLGNMQTEPIVEDQFEELFREQDLLNSPKFLIGLLEIANADQSQSIFKRLQKLTNEDYRDRKSWEQWIEELNKNR